MSANSPRELVAQGAIIMSLCVGGWLMFVKPKIAEVAKLEQQLADYSAASNSSLNQQTVQEAAKRMASIRERLSTIVQYNNLAHDSSKFYGLVMDLADTHGVRVHSLQPGSVMQTPDAKTVTITRINLGVEGGFEQVASFLDAICNLNAFIRPIVVQMSPSRVPGRTTVDVNFACDILSFALSDALASMDGGANNAQH